MKLELCEIPTHETIASKYTPIVNALRQAGTDRAVRIEFEEGRGGKLREGIYQMGRRSFPGERVSVRIIDPTHAVIWRIKKANGATA